MKHVSTNNKLLHITLHKLNKRHIVKNKIVSRNNY